MTLRSLTWKLASPYDAYVSHVVRLHHALERIRYFSERALAYEAGLQSSVRFIPGNGDPVARAQRFRAQLTTAAAEMSDEQFEAFILDLGGGTVADVEADRAQATSRLSHMTRGLAEYFAMAGREMTVLEQRGYNPHRPDVARQLKANGLPEISLADYRHSLHELGARVGQKAS